MNIPFVIPSRSRGTLMLTGLFVVVLCLVGVDLVGQQLYHDQASYDVWKVNTYLGGQSANTLPAPHREDHTNGEPQGQQRGGGSTCQCWHTPNDTYTLINNNSQWNASGFQNADDGSYGPVVLPFNYYLYGQYYNSIYINTNGNITMGNWLTSFSAAGFPDPNYVIVGAFWADVDLRPAGANINKVQFKVTPSALYVNWTNVGYYSQMTDKLNTFQIIITDGNDPVVPSGANTSFCYKDMQWTTGAANSGVNGFGGNPANVGANKGDGINYMQFGRYDHAGTDYDGPFGVNDGVSFLDDQHFPFTTDITTGNIPPIVSGQSICDSLVLCVGDPGTLDFVFLSPEPGQITTPSASAPTLTGFNVVSSTSGQTATISVAVNPVLADTGYHYVLFQGTDNGTPALTTEVSIVVHVLPSPVLPPGSLSVCGNGTPVLLYGGLNGTPPLGGDWYDPNGSAHNATFAPATDAPGVYTYSVDTTGGCPLIGTVDVTSYAMQNDSVVMDALCHDDGTGSIQVISTGNGGPWNYLWTDDNGTVLQNTNASIGDIFLGSGGTYHVLISEGANGNGCVDSLMAVINEPPPVEITFLSADTLICRTGAAALVVDAIGGSGQLTARWSTGFTGVPFVPAPLTTSSYQVWVTDANMCSSDTLSVEVAVNPPLTLQLSDTAFTCPDVDLFLTPDSAYGGDGELMYDWGQGFASDPAYTINTHTSQQVCVTLTDGCETPDITQCIWVSVTPLPELILSADTTLGCDPFAVRFNVIDTTNGATVDWSFGDGLVIPGPAGIVGHSYTDPGQYDVSVVVHWPNGCDDDTTIINMITVAAVPSAEFTWDPQPPSVLEPEVQFIEQAGPYATSYAWDFAGLGEDTAANPIFVFPADLGNTYPVQLIVTNYLGCADTTVRNVEVIDQFLVFIPNAFTPDGDGVNDVLYVQGRDIDTKDLRLMIFDRWGEKIFESTGRFEGWDGTYGGSPVKNGVYAWRLNARSAYTGQPVQLLGHVTVLR